MSTPMPQLKAPKSYLVVESSNFNNSKSRHEAVVSGHPFNYMMDVFVPDCPLAPADIWKDDGEAFYEATIEPCILIHRAFIEAFVRRGQIALLTVGAHIDTQNVICLTNRGHLVLHLDKETYESLGLQGTPSVFNNKVSLQFVVDIDLLQDCFVPGKKNYERVRECLSLRFNALHHVLFTWNPNDPEVSPSSVMRFLLSVGYQCRARVLEPTPRLLHSVTQCPLIDHSSLEGGDRSVSYQDLWLWLGSLGCNINLCSENADDFVSTYSCPEPNTSISGMYRCSFTGLIEAKSVKEALNSLRDCCKKNRFAWCALSVHGFCDAPVSWGTREHGFLTEGDNLYTYVVFPDDSYWLFYSCGSYDICP